MPLPLPALVPERVDRGRILGRHRQDLPGGLQFTGQLGLISDRNFLEQYYELEWDTLKDQTTDVLLRQTLGNSSWNVLAGVRLNERGEAVSKRVFADASDLHKAKNPGLPDGMRVTGDGTIFATAPGGVLIMDATGKRLGLIRTGTAISNCAFGDDGRTLYMTSNDFLARVRLKVSGAR